MRRSFQILPGVGLLIALAMVSAPAATLAARALQPAELLAVNFQTAYDAALRADADTVDPVLRSRQAALKATETVATAKTRKPGQPEGSKAAQDAALKAATKAIGAARPVDQSAGVKAAYLAAWKAAFDALSRDNKAGPSADAQRAALGLPDELQSLALRGAKITADRTTATTIAAAAVSRAAAIEFAADGPTASTADSNASSQR